MVRVYQRTYRNHRHGKQYKPYTSYSKESLEKAIAEIKAGSTSLIEAATKHSIPFIHIVLDSIKEPVKVKSGCHKNLLRESCLIVLLKRNNYSKMVTPH